MIPSVVQEPEVLEHLIVLRAQLGEREAYEALFKRYNSRLLYYLRRLLSLSSDAEDVLQEVWIVVVKKVSTLDRPEAFKSWIYRIAHNRAISKMRKHRRYVPLDDLPIELEIDPTTDEKDDLGAFADYDANSLHKGLDALSPPHREVLALRFLEELSYEQIAAVVDCSLGTVRSRLYYAKRSLHGTLVTSQTPERRNP